MSRKVLLPAIVAVLIGGVATQSTGQGVVLIERVQAAPVRQEGIVRVQLAIQLFVAGPTDESEEAERQRERARRAIYDLAAKECLLRGSIANDCRLESVNVNLNRQGGPQQQPSGYQVMGNMAYQITLK